MEVGVDIEENIVQHLGKLVKTGDDHISFIVMNDTEFLGRVYE